MNPEGKAGRGMAFTLLFSWVLLALVFALSRAYPRLDALREIGGTLLANWPPGIPQAGKAILGRVLGLLWIPIILAVPYGAGTAVARLVRLDGMAKPFIRLALGLGVVSMLVHGLGISGLLFLPVLGIVMAGLAVKGILLAVRERAWKIPIDADSKVPLIGVAVLLAMIYLLTRLPITIEDSLIAHFAAPEMYLFEHKIFAEPQNFLWHMPLGLEMVFLPAWGFGGIEVAKMVNLGVLIVLAGFIWNIARRFDAEKRQSVGAWGAFWAMSAGFLIEQAWQGKNDIALAMFLAGAVYCLLEYLEGKRRFLIGAGLLLGMAVAVKYSALLYVAAGLLALLAVAGYRRTRGGLLPLVIAGVIPMLGWLGANWLYLGNPFHPFLYGIFHGLAWDASLQSSWSESARRVAAMSAGGEWGWIKSLPGMLGDPNGGSMVLLAFLPLVLLRSGGKEYGFIKYLMGFAFLLWLPFRETGRYLYPVLPLLGAMMGPVSLPEFGYSPWKRVRGLLWGLLLVLAGINSVSIIRGNGWKYFAGISNRDGYKAESYGSWDSMRRWINSRVPERGRVLFVGEPRRLWMERRVLSYGPVYLPVIWKAVRESGNAGEVARKMRQAGITHIVYNQITAEYNAYAYYPGLEWTPGQLLVEADFFRRYCRVVRYPDYIDGLHGSFYVYEVARKANSRSNPLYFLPEAEGRFNQAWSHMEKKEYSEASQALAQATGVVWDELYVQALSGRISWLEGGYPAGVKMLGPGIKAGLITDLNLIDYGSCLSNLGKYDEAVKVFSRASLLYRTPTVISKLGIALYGRGWMRYRKGDYRGAVKDLELAKYLWVESPEPGKWLEMAKKRIRGG